MLQCIAFLPAATGFSQDPQSLAALVHFIACTALQDIGAPAFSAPAKDSDKEVHKGQPLPNGQQSQPEQASAPVARADCDGALAEWKNFVTSRPAESPSSRVDRINSLSRFFRT